MFSEVYFSPQFFERATCYSAAVTFYYVGNNSNGYTMDDSESISVLSEGGAAVNAYGSIVGDHEATGSGVREV